MSDEPKTTGSLSTMGKIWEGIKHVGSKALKWAAIGGLIGGAILALPAIIVAAPAGLVSWLPGIGSTIAGWAGSGIGGAFAAGAVGLGAVTGILGAVKGLAGVSEAIDQADDRSISNLQRGQMREFQMASMQQQYAEKQISLAAKAQQLPGMGQGVGRG